MKRWTIRILLMLFFGVATTVGVAWGLAWWRAFPYSAEQELRLRPLLGSFVVDVLAFALVALVLWRAARFLQENLRFSRDQCPQCGFDLHANFGPGCPECGWNREP